MSYTVRCRECGKVGPIHPFLQLCDACVEALRAKEQAAMQRLEELRGERWEQSAAAFEQAEEERRAFQDDPFAWLRHLGVVAQGDRLTIRGDTSGEASGGMAPLPTPKKPLSDEELAAQALQDARPKTEEELLAPFSGREVAGLRFVKHLVGIGVLTVGAEDGRPEEGEKGEKEQAK